MHVYYNLLFFIYGFVLIICDNEKYLWYIHFIVLLIGVSFIIDFLLTKKRSLNINIFLNTFIAFSLFALLSSFWSLDFLNSAKKGLTLLLIFINILIIYNINKKYNNYIYLIYGFFFAILANFFWLLGIIDLGLTYQGWRFPGSVLQANKYVFILMFILILIIFLLTSIKRSNTFKGIMLVLLTITLYMIFLTGSKSGLVTSSLLIALYIFLNFNSKNIYFLLLTVIVVYVFLKYTSIIDFMVSNTTLDIEITLKNFIDRINMFLTFSNSDTLDTGGSTGDRISMIQDAFEMWANKPLFGNGIAAFEIKYGKYSHNNIMELLVSLGLVGFILYYSLYAYLFSKIKEIDKSKNKIMFYIFIFIFLLFDQSIVSYYGKFKILALLILFLMIQESIGNKSLLDEN